MSVFYLLPPRPLLADRFASFLHTLFPGLDWDSRERADLVTLLDRAAAAHADVFLVYRDDLPEGEPPAQALADGFGAEPGDEVVEVRSGGTGTRRWRIS